MQVGRKISALFRAPRALRRAGLVLAALAGWAAVVAATATVVERSHEDGRSALRDRFDSRTTVAARFVETYVAQTGSRKRALAERQLAGRRVSRASFDQFAANDMQQAAVLLDSRGRVIHVAPHRADLVGKPLTSKYTHLREAVAGRTAASGVVPSAARGVPLVALAVPFDTPDGRRVFSGGYEVADTPLAGYLRNGLSNLRNDAYLIDSDGQVIASNRDSAELLLRRRDPALATALTEGGSGTFTRAGRPWRFVARPVAGTSWSLVTALSERDLYAPLARGGQRLVWLLVALFAAGGLMVMALVAWLWRTRRALVADVARRRRTEAELREAEVRFRQAFDEAPIGVALVSLDGLFLRVNRALCEISGYPAEDLVGMDFQSITHPDDLAESLDHLRALAAGEAEGIQVEKRYLSAAGDTVDALLSVSLVRDDEARPLYFVSEIMDITARRAAEQSAESAKQEFFALVSHELRTPLTSMVGYLDLLLEDDEDREDGEEAANYHRVLKRNTLRLQRLVSDMLFVAQHEAGRGLSLAMQTVELESLVEQAVAAAAPRAEEAGIALEASTGPVPALDGDPERLGQALDNLISNAIKFTPAGGTIGVRLHRDDGKVHIIVTDTGVGIPPDEVERLFERFFRASNATREHIPGVGLGLHITRAIVDGHGGHIEVLSQPGQGTSFTLTLPCPVAPAGGEPHEPATGLATIGA